MVQLLFKFVVNGVMLIYGLNGLGKSGYCWIVKKICYCLYDVILWGNVFELVLFDCWEVILIFCVEGDKMCSVVWDDWSFLLFELGWIFVFDSDVVGLYVDVECNIEFLLFEFVFLINFVEVL